jgi:hypothetical protein
MVRRMANVNSTLRYDGVVSEVDPILRTTVAWI